MQVTAVVVHYENEDRTRLCLESLKAQEDVPLTIVLVDHCPGPTELSQAGVEYIRPQENRGFGAGVAKGFAYCPNDFLLLLNPDAQAEPAWAREMLMVMGESPRHGMAACRVLGGDGSFLDSAGLGLSRGGMGILRGHGRQADLSRNQLDRTHLLGPAGSAALYRRGLLEDLGGFPDAYFLYYEDLEVAFRGRRRGWSCAWLDAPLVRHRHESSAGERKAYYLRRAHQLFLDRNWPEAWKRKYRLSTWGVQAGSLLRAGLKGKLRQSLQGRQDAQKMKATPFDDPAPSEAWLSGVV